MSYTELAKKDEPSLDYRGQALLYLESMGVDLCWGLRHGERLGGLKYYEREAA